MHEVIPSDLEYNDGIEVWRPGGAGAIICREGKALDASRDNNELAGDGVGLG